MSREREADRTDFREDPEVPRRPSTGPRRVTQSKLPWYICGMTITLTPEQQALLSAYVARGDFSSIEEAALQLIDERIAERAAEEGDDLAWAKPYVDEARAAVARGDVLTLDEHKARNAARLANAKR